MAIVGLSWVLATLLGAMPFLLSETCRAPNVRMSVVDAIFESASGFSGTGATVLTNLEDPTFVPRAILFWRSETHFLGGLGIMVLFVAILGQGSAGKALLRTEIPGPSRETGTTRTQHAAWVFTFIYLALNATLVSMLCRSIKVIRHILLVKIVAIELEHAYHPTVVRPLRIGGRAVEDPEMRKNVLVYFALILIISVSSWLALDVLEPDDAWSKMGHARHEKLIDCASAVGATLNGVGPGLGTIGAVENYEHFQPASKILFVLLMLLGRLELFVVLVLFLPGFWRKI